MTKNKGPLELEERERLYHVTGRPFEVRGRTGILVDDGLATGSSMRAAALALRAQQPAEVIVAVPVAPPATCASLEAEAEEVISAVQPRRSARSAPGTNASSSPVTRR